MGVHDENLLYIDKDAVEARHPKKVVSGNAQGAHDGKWSNSNIVRCSGCQRLSDIIHGRNCILSLWDVNKLHFLRKQLSVFVQDKLRMPLT
jgi:hypothetical protein